MNDLIAKSRARSAKQLEAVDGLLECTRDSTARANLQTLRTKLVALIEYCDARLAALEKPTSGEGGAFSVEATEAYRAR